MSIHSVPSVPLFWICCSFFFLLLLNLGWSCNPRDRAALILISNAFEVPLWPTSINGSVTDCCRWNGITCSTHPVVNGSSTSNSSQRVVSVILEDIELGGQLPKYFGGLFYLQTLVLTNLTLTGFLPSSIGSLPSLRILKLRQNGFSGTIPEELYQLRSLEIIDLTSNYLSGPLSMAIENLSSLRELHLSNNQLSGIIPEAFHGLKNLQSIDMSKNLFSGSLPVSLSSCTSLRLLNVARNNLSGTVDIGFTALSGLEFLGLTDNNFTGSILQHVYACKSLQFLYLGNIGMHGEISWELFPTSLRLVRLEGNSFFNITKALLSFQRFPNLALLDLTGSFYQETVPVAGITGFPNLLYMRISDAELVGEFPMWLSRSDKLRLLDLSGNRLSGEIPTFIFQLKSLTNASNNYEAFTEKYNIAGVTIGISYRPMLNLRGNNFSGNTWMNLSYSTALQYVDLSANSLSGSIPSGISRMKRLLFLSLSQNKISGTIPEEFYQLQNLEYIKLHVNYLHGSLSPAIGNLSSLCELSLDNNQFSGIIPDAFHGLKELEYLSMADNLFSGPLPFSLSNCSSLHYLDVQSNNLSGRLHIDFTALSGLEALVLTKNHFTGSNLKPILACKALQILDLGGFEMTGNIDWELFPTSLTTIKLESNSFSNITVALTRLQQLSNLTALSLTGSFKNETIPATGITGFSDIVYFGLRNTQLLGELPEWFSRFDKCIALDLTGNYFSGEIPIFLSRLKSLSNTFDIDAKYEETVGDSTLMAVARLDLSNNMFSGNTWMHLSNLTNLHFLYLSHNSLTGSIPNDISRMKRLEHLDLRSNNISGTIPPSLTGLTFLSYFCVANNMLTGNVPTGHQFSSYPLDCFDGNPGLCYVGKPGCYSPPMVATQPNEENEDMVGVIDMGIAFVLGVAVGYTITFVLGVTHYFLTLRKKLNNCSSH